MTQKQTIATIRALGLVCRVRDGEYRVNYRDGQESTAYYTNDSDDALATARIGFPPRFAGDGVTICDMLAGGNV